MLLFIAKGLDTSHLYKKFNSDNNDFFFVHLLLHYKDLKMQLVDFGALICHYKIKIIFIYAYCISRNQKKTF